MKMVLALGVVTLAATGRAQIFDNTALENNFEGCSGGNGQAIQITNSNSYDIHLSSVYFSGWNSETQQFDFFLTDGNYHVLSQTFRTEHFSGEYYRSLIGTTVSWTLKAGGTYYIGAMPQTYDARAEYIYPSDMLPQNGIQPGNCASFGGYGDPSKYANGLSDHGPVEMAWQLNNSAAPEPMTLLAISVGVAGLSARRRRQ